MQEKEGADSSRSVAEMLQACQITTNDWGEEIKKSMTLLGVDGCLITLIYLKR